MTTISELRAGQGKVNIDGTITELGNTRIFNKFGKELKVADAIFQDDTGSIKLTLWNDDVTRFKEGDKVKIIDGFVGEYQGDKQLTSGKFGRMEKILSKDSAGNVEVKSEVVNAKPLEKKKTDVFKEKIDKMPEEENFESEQGFYEDSSGNIEEEIF